MKVQTIHPQISETKNSRILNLVDNDNEHTKHFETQGLAKVASLFRQVNKSFGKMSFGKVSFGKMSGYP